MKRDFRGAFINLTDFYTGKAVVIKASKFNGAHPCAGGSALIIDGYTRQDIVVKEDATVILKLIDEELE
jgi:hypothetical protein